MSRGDRRRYLVAYDISDDRRRGQVFTILEGFGDWAQFSVFFCELTERELVQLRMKLRDEIHGKEDQVMILDLGRATRPLENNLEVLGRGYRPPVRSNII